MTRRKTMVEILAEIGRKNTGVGSTAPGWNKDRMADLTATAARAYAVLSMGADPGRSITTTPSPITDWSFVFFQSGDVFDVDPVTGVVTALLPMTVEAAFNADTDISGGNTTVLASFNWTDRPYEAYKTRVEGKGNDDMFSLTGAVFDLDEGETCQIDWYVRSGSASVDINSATFTVAYIPRTWPPGEGPANKRIPPS